MVISIPSFGFAQKAFKVVHYVGKQKDMEVHLKLADGYLPASEIDLKRVSTGKTFRFIPDICVPDDPETCRFMKFLKLEREGNIL